MSAEQTYPATAEAVKATIDRLRAERAYLFRRCREREVEADLLRAALARKAGVA